MYKNIRRGAAVLLGGLAAAGLCLALVFALINAPKDAKATVLAALSSAAGERDKAMAEARKNFPALGLLSAQSRPESGQNTATLTFISISGLDEADAATALLTGAALRVDTAYAQGVFDSTARFSLLSRDFPAVHAYLGPDIAAAGAPDVSDLALSIDRASPLAELARLGLLAPQGGLNYAELDEYISYFVNNYAAQRKSALKTALESGEYQADDDGRTYRLQLDAQTLAQAMPNVPAGSLQAEFVIEDGVLYGFDGIFAAESGSEWRLIADFAAGTWDIAARCAGIALEFRVTESFLPQRYALQIEGTVDGAARVAAVFEADSVNNYAFSVSVDRSVTVEAAGSIVRLGGEIVNEVPHIRVAVDDEYLSSEVVVLELSLKTVTRARSGELKPPMCAAADSGSVSRMVSEYEALFMSFLESIVR